MSGALLLLQHADLPCVAGGLDLQRLKHLLVFGCHRRDARHRLRPFDRHSVMLDRVEQMQRAFRRESGLALVRAHAHAHHAVQNQRHEAVGGPRPNALQQAGIHRPDFEFGFQYLEAALDVSQEFVALDDRTRLEVLQVGHDQRLPSCISSRRQASSSMASRISSALMSALMVLAKWTSHTPS